MTITANEMIRHGATRQSQIRNSPVSIALAQSPYTVPANISEVNVTTTGGNVRVNLPNSARQIKVNKTSSDSYLVTLWVAGTQIGEIAGERSSATVESGQITKDEPWYPFDLKIGKINDETVIINKFGRKIGRGTAGTATDIGYDQTALALCCSSLPSGGVIQVDNLSTIYWNANLTFPSNLVLQGRGILKQLNGANVAQGLSYIISKSNIQFKDITIDGNIANNATACGFAVNSSNYISSDRVTFQNMSTALTTWCASGAFIRGLYFNDCMFQSFGTFNFNSADAYAIKDYVFRGCKFYVSAGSIVFSKARGVIFEGNELYNMGGRLYFSACKSVSCIGNDLSDVNLNTASAGSIHVVSCRDTKLIDNNIEFVTNPTLETSCIYLTTDLDRITVSLNDLYCNHLANAKRGINVAGAANNLYRLTLKDNKIYDPALTGITLAYGGTDAIFGRHHIQDNDIDAPNATGYGIELNPISRSLLTGNIIYIPNGTGIYGPAHYCTFRDNDIEALTLYNILYGVNTVLYNNRGINPFGVVASKFDNTAHVIQPFKNSNAVALDAGPTVASQDYTLWGTPATVVSTGGADVDITIKDVAGNTIDNPGVTCAVRMVPGWKINFGAFTVAPTVVVVFE